MVAEEWWQDGPVYRKRVPGPVFRTEVILRQRRDHLKTDHISWHRNFDVSAAQDGSAYETELHWCDGDYVMIQIVPGGPRELYVGTRDGLTLLGTGDRGELRKLALGHKDPAALAAVEAYQAALEYKAIYGTKRCGVDTVVGKLKPKSYFLGPGGTPGYVIGVGKKVVTWRWLEELPEGVEAVQLADLPDWTDYDEYHRNWLARRHARDVTTA